MKPKQILMAGFSRKHQKGLALLTIMSFLLVLTVVGVSTMKTSRLEQMMAGNMQWSNIAFQAAETALVSSYGNPDWVAEIDPATVPSDSYDPPNTKYSYDYSRYFVDFTSNAKRQSSNAWSAKSTRAANFKTSASGAAKEAISGATLATSNLEEGMYLIVPKI